MGWKCYRCQKSNEDDAKKCDCGTLQHACLNCKYMEQTTENGGYCSGIFSGCRSMKISIGNNTCHRFVVKPE